MERPQFGTIAYSEFSLSDSKSNQMEEPAIERKTQRRGSWQETRRQSSTVDYNDDNQRVHCKTETSLKENYDKMTRIFVTLKGELCVVIASIVRRDNGFERFYIVQQDTAETRPGAVCS